MNQIKSPMHHDEPPAVLIVEDEPLLRMLAIDIVEEAGLAAVEARDAAEAIEIMEKRPDIAVVFTDVNMPGSMSGTELASVIRDRWPPVSLLVTSGKVHIDPKDLPEGTVFVPKPYDIDAVADTLQRLTPRRSPDWRFSHRR